MNAQQTLILERLIAHAEIERNREDEVNRIAMARARAVEMMDRARKYE